MSVARRVRCACPLGCFVQGAEPCPSTIHGAALYRRPPTHPAVCAPCVGVYDEWGGSRGRRILRRLHGPFRTKRPLCYMFTFLWSTGILHDTRLVESFRTRPRDPKTVNHSGRDPPCAPLDPSRLEARDGPRYQWLPACAMTLYDLTRMEVIDRT